MRSVAIAASSQNANEIVAAVTGSRIAVYAFHISFSGNVNAKWQSGSTDKTGLYYGAAAAQVAAPGVSNRQGGAAPLFVCASGEALNIHLSAATAVGGHVVYDIES